MKPADFLREDGILGLDRYWTCHLLLRRVCSYLCAKPWRRRIELHIVCVLRTYFTSRHRHWLYSLHTSVIVPCLRRIHEPVGRQGSCNRLRTTLQRPVCCVTRAYEGQCPLCQAIDGGERRCLPLESSASRVFGVDKPSPCNASTDASNTAHSVPAK